MLLRGGMGLCVGMRSLLLGEREKEKRVEGKFKTDHVIEVINFSSHVARASRMFTFYYKSNTFYLSFSACSLSQSSFCMPN